MNKRDFVKQRQPAWDRYEGLLNRLGRKRKRVSSREVTEFSRLFRELANDLATVRSRGWGVQLTTYLNHLVSRGYNAFYVSPPGYVQKAIHFLTAGFPQLLRANLWYFVTAAALFFGPLAIGWAVIQNDPSLANRIVPDAQLLAARHNFEKRDESGKELTEEEKRARAREYREQRSFMGGFYVYNNASIALRSFGLGVTLGIGTAYTLLFNGIYIGAIAGYVVAEADAGRFLSFVITHGSFELTAICVAGAGGLILGNALLHPGNRTRWEAIRIRGLDSVKLAIGAAVMLVIAALIEGFWSPAPFIPPMIKYLVGTIAWVVVALYFLLAGRGESVENE